MSSQRVLLAWLVLALSAVPLGISRSDRAAAGVRGDPSAWEGTWSTPGPALASVLAIDAAGSVAAGYDGDVRALDVAGAPLWSAHVEGGDVGNELVLLSDVVVVPSGDRISALERSTGALRWEQPAARSRLAGGVLPDGSEVVLAATPRGELALFEAASGTRRIREMLPTPPSGAPHVWLSGAAGVVAWSDDGSCCHLGGIDLETGTMRWQAKITHRSTVPVVHRGVVVVATYTRASSTGRATAYDAETGDIRWETPVEGTFGTGLSGDAAGRDVVVANAEGSVIALDVATGRLRWTSEPIEPSDEAHPKIAGARVFLTPLSIGAVEIERRTGEVLASGPFTPDVYVHYSAGAPGRFEVLVGNGFESAVWAFEPPARAASESG